MTEMWNRPYQVTVEVDNKECKMLQKFAGVGLTNLRVADLRSSKKGSVKHLIELGQDQAKSLPADFKGSLTARQQIKGKQTTWFESDGCEVCNTILANDAFLIASKSREQDKIIYSFMVPTFEAYTKTIRALENAGHKVNVLEMAKFEPKTGVLTENQEKVFWLALKSGFFDFPRKIGLRELSAKLGVRPSTLSETLRRGIRRLLEHFFKEENMRA